MLDLPAFGTKVRVWPAKPRVLRDPPSPYAGGSAAHARFLPSAGATVTWSNFHLDQYRHGDIRLHAPPCEKHDFGDEKRGKLEECSRCGRDDKSAAQHDRDREKGIALAKAAAEAAKTAPKAPAKE